MIGKVVSGAWKQFRNWWVSQKQKNVEEKARISLQERLKEAKKQVAKENVQRREGRGLKKQMAEHER